MNQPFLMKLKLWLYWSWSRSRSRSRGGYSKKSDDDHQIENHQENYESDEEEEEDEDDDNDDEIDVAINAENGVDARLLGPDEPERMHLTPAERQWALIVKDLIEGVPELDNLCEFEYAQLALIEHDNVEGDLKRAYQIQLYRQEYGIINTLEDDSKIMQYQSILFPEH